MEGGLRSELLAILVSLPAIALGFTVHEAAHAWTAVKLGDPTPKLRGRFTLNPLRHLDPVGIMMILVFRFGWARPVEYNPANLKKPVEHSLLICAAGPLANLLTAALFLVLLLPLTRFAFPFREAVLMVVYQMVWINTSLFLFNLLPLPPLDGSHFLFWAIPTRFQALREGYLKYGYFLLLGIILLQAFTRIQLLPIAAMTDSLIALGARLLHL